MVQTLGEKWIQTTRIKVIKTRTKDILLLNNITNHLNRITTRDTKLRLNSNTIPTKPLLLSNINKVDTTKIRINIKDTANNNNRITVVNNSTVRLSTIMDPEVTSSKVKVSMVKEDTSNNNTIINLLRIMVVGDLQGGIGVRMNLTI